MTTTDIRSSRHAARRRGLWVYGDHAGLNPGWLLSGTTLVLDFDRHDNSGSVPGAYQLWRDGREIGPIDHYVDGAMEYLETQPPSELLLGNPARQLGPPEEAELRSVVRTLAANRVAGTVAETIRLALGVLQPAA